MEQEGFDPTAMAGNITTSTIPTMEQFGLGKKDGGVGAEVVMTPELLAGFERIQSGEFTVDSTPGLICIDERPSEDESIGYARTATRVSGGPAGASHAHDLAMGDLNVDADEVSVVSEGSRKLDVLGASPHTDDHDPACGCGQIKTAAEQYSLIGNEIDKVAMAQNALAEAASAKGGRSPGLDPESAAALRAKAETRLNQPEFFAVNRGDVLQAAQDNSSGRKEVVTGSHQAVAVVWVTQPGKTIDTSAVKQQLGVEVFVVNAGDFRQIAEAMNVTGHAGETELTEKALAASSIATANSLTSEKMSILVV